MRNKGIILLIIIALAFALVFPQFPFVNNYLLHVSIVIFLHIIFGLSWNLLGGYTGQISFGHAMFLGMGAYTTMILVTQYEINPLTAILLGAVFAVFLALPVGLVLFKLRGPYFALGTLATAEIIRLVALNWSSLTGGGVGILLLNIPPINVGFMEFQLGSKESFYYFTLLFTIITIIVMYWLLRRKEGYYFLSIREDEDASLALGIDTRLYKTYALLISAFFTGISGGIMALVVGIIEPQTVFAVHLSAEMIFVAVIGGIGTIMGPIIGSFILVILTEILYDWVGTAYLILYGLLLMLVILYMPEGVYGWLKRKFLSTFSRKEV
ncbi:branched-chain amino acid transport system permease protein [Caldalkalibacillus uzonensis]|uniref:Branched-chain amino acid transport system permease protein n=1 Tax=Caldalkalibacillus uzonensis TaxID=353224 RepID=A0ABU0CPS0_9BACI|nr:branched-chain amino acid ABC transporter permease [Caldalkalibacillus uzonensis]MDQ0338142.1 branched-chain amino acid transport system permease protein [Caldalkalibacillus uzonensis]